MKKALKFTKKLKINEIVSLVLAVSIFIMFILNNFVGRLNSGADQEIRKDIDSQYYALNSFFEANSYFPSIADFANEQWRSENMPNLEVASLESPGGLLITNQDYIYSPKSANEPCVDSEQKCTDFLLSAVMTDQAEYVLKSF